MIVSISTFGYTFFSLISNTPDTARSPYRLARYPMGIFRGKEHSKRCDIRRLTEPAKWSSRNKLFTKLPIKISCC